MKEDELFEEALGVKKVGRKPLIYSGGPTVEEMIKVYLEERSVRRASERLGISVGSLRKYMSLAKTLRATGRNPDESAWSVRRLSPLAEWIKARKEPLPRKVAEICAISGFSKDQVYFYLKRRATAAAAYLQHLGNLSNLPVVLTDVKGRRIATGMFSQYELKVDRYSLVVTINATLNFGGKAIFRLPFSRYRELFDD